MQRHSPELQSRNSFTGAPVSLSLPNRQLDPFETRRLNFQSVLGTLGLEDLSGMINLSFSFKGHAGDLLLAAASLQEKPQSQWRFTPEIKASDESLRK